LDLRRLCVNIRLLFLGLLLLARPIFASDYVCSDLELDLFDTFLDENKKDFDKKALINYSEDDPCSNVTYVKLSEYISDIKTKSPEKKESCAVAVDFCKNDKSEETRMVLQVLMIPNCGKGTKFVITRQECQDYFLK
jgi:hypothetical protein